MSPFPYTATPLLIPCLFTLAYNAIVLGATFGYMSRDGIEGSDHFFEFVSAHQALYPVSTQCRVLGVGLAPVWWTSYRFRPQRHDGKTWYPLRTGGRP